LALKQRAMACFASQMQIQAYDEHILALNRYRTYTLPAHVKAAEAFLLLGADELRAFVACLPAWNSTNHTNQIDQNRWQNDPPVPQDEMMRNVWASANVELRSPNFPAEITRLKIQLDETQKQLQQAHEQWAQSEARWNAFVHSRSWRLTQPLRRLANMARGLWR